MYEQHTIEQQKEDTLKKVFDCIHITRSILNKRNFAPKGYIYYHIAFKNLKDEKYTGVRMIEIAREDAIGRDQIEMNIKMQIAEKHWPIEYKYAIATSNENEPETEGNQHLPEGADHA